MGVGDIWLTCGVPRDIALYMTVQKDSMLVNKNKLVVLYISI